MVLCSVLDGSAMIAPNAAIWKNNEAASVMLRFNFLFVIVVIVFDNSRIKNLYLQWDGSGAEVAVAFQELTAGVGEVFYPLSSRQRKQSTV